MSERKLSEKIHYGVGVFVSFIALGTASATARKYPEISSWMVVVGFGIGMYRQWIRSEYEKLSTLQTNSGGSHE